MRSRSASPTRARQGVVVADLDQEGATDVATDLGNAIAIGCDVADPAHANVVIGAAEQAFGPVDLFCANAGVAVGEELASPAEWDLAIDVNVRAHIAAAQRLVPGWLERGSGYFLATASAAGIVSQIGSAPYAVTKHAAVAFAEWLSITYGGTRRRRELPVPDGRQHSAADGQRQPRDPHRHGRGRACSSPRRSPTRSSTACATDAS